MLKTEMRNPHTAHIDKMSTMEMLEAINRENYNAVRAVEEASAEIAKAIDMITEAIQNGHRLFYIGAGTSGRLGVLDAVECPPTYGVPPELVVGILAGGEKCMFRSSEGAEDAEEAGIRDVAEVEEGDVIVGISVAGGAAYVAGALREAKRKGAKAIALTCNENTKIEKEADLTIITDTGAEATVLGRFCNTKLPAFVIKECGDFTSVFCGTKLLQGEVIRSIAHFAGCHVYTEENDVLYANRNFITIHAARAGRKHIRLRECCHPYELYEERFYDPGEAITLEMAEGETKMFALLQEKKKPVLLADVMNIPAAGEQEGKVAVRRHLIL
ncbi:MAG: N-acetylmuramic acid 6-phosphate etherase [Clostridia bacterium]|nr:N-acetylmuramic acid 6-phosphate etherase [Clostridia bacterium]